MSYVSTSRGFATVHTYSSDKAKLDTYVAETNDGARLDLSHQFRTLGLAYADRLAYRWALSIGAVRVYRRRASHRRFLRKLSGRSL